VQPVVLSVLDHDPWEQEMKRIPGDRGKERKALEQAGSYQSLPEKLHD